MKIDIKRTFWNDGTYEASIEDGSTRINLGLLNVDERKVLAGQFREAADHLMEELEGDES